MNHHIMTKLDTMKKNNSSKYNGFTLFKFINVYKEKKDEYYSNGNGKSSLYSKLSGFFSGKKETKCEKEEEEIKYVDCEEKKEKLFENIPEDFDMNEEITKFIPKEIKEKYDIYNNITFKILKREILYDLHENKRLYNNEISIGNKQLISIDDLNNYIYSLIDFEIDDKTKKKRKIKNKIKKASDLI
tara:strand:- start:404 stop:964 length:561 start_codon:yes stop_codon:yes gene_type:complete